MTLSKEAQVLPTLEISTRNLLCTMATCQVGMGEREDGEVQNQWKKVAEYVFRAAFLRQVKMRINPSSSVHWVGGLGQTTSPLHTHRYNYDARQPMKRRGEGCHQVPEHLAEPVMAPIVLMEHPWEGSHWISKHQSFKT